MTVNPNPPGSPAIDDTHGIPEAQRPQWQADVATLRAHQVAHEQSHLQMGDLYNEMQQRWDVKMPALTQAAGISYHAARQRAHFTQLVPPGSKLRATGLGYSILRLLAPLADPEPWARHALAQSSRRVWRRQKRSSAPRQAKGELCVRAFAELLVSAGLRRSRGRDRCRPPRLHCDTILVFPQPRVHIHGEESDGWLCNARCAAAYFAARREREERSEAARRRALMRFESPSPSPASAALTPESQSPHPVPNPESEFNNPKAEAAPTRHESQSPPSAPIQDPFSPLSHESQSPPASSTEIWRAIRTE